MNQFPYILPIQNNQIILDELLKMKEQLTRIENAIKKLNKKKEKNYLEKDDNYYII